MTWRQQFRAWWKYDVLHGWERKKEHALRVIVAHTPKRLVYFAAIRLGVNATTGKYSTQVVPDLTFMDALKRWDMHQ